ncbi:unnamed protein product [Ectocarpus sp. 4 AP-2014]
MATGVAVRWTCSQRVAVPPPPCVPQQRHNVRRRRSSTTRETRRQQQEDQTPQNTPQKEMLPRKCLLLSATVDATSGCGTRGCGCA